MEKLAFRVYDDRTDVSADFVYDDCDDRRGTTFPECNVPVVIQISF